jgi:hypothetical protein
VERLAIPVELERNLRPSGQDFCARFLRSAGGHPRSARTLREDLVGGWNDCMMVQESDVQKRARLDHDPRVQEHRFG